MTWWPTKKQMADYEQGAVVSLLSPLWIPIAIGNWLHDMYVRTYYGVRLNLANHPSLYASPMSRTLEAEVQAWLAENRIRFFQTGRRTLAFHRATDAIAFKMRWM